MAQTAESEDEAPKKASKLPLLLGIVLAIAGGAGGFAAVQLGLLGVPSHSAEAHTEAPPRPIPELAFVPLDPLVITIPGQSARNHLRFSAQLEVNPEFVADVEAVKPRITDVLNSYLRAVETSDLENPAALMTLRSQMLRRVKIVTGEGRVNDLLIMEFVMN